MNKLFTNPYFNLIMLIICLASFVFCLHMGWKMIAWWASRSLTAIMKPCCLPMQVKSFASEKKPSRDGLILCSKSNKTQIKW